MPGARGTLVPAVAVAAAVVVGALVRAGHTLASDFPLNDGGLFYVMVRDLQAAGFALPATTTYNDAALPYAYPPLGFYLAGLLAAVGPWSLLDEFRWLPLAFSVLTIPAFWLLARDLLPDRRAALLATGAFALLPMSFQWVIMGGGLTRGLGFVWAILALWQVHRLYTWPGRATLLLAIVLAALTVLSHPAMAWFLAYSSIVLFLAHGRSAAALRRSVLVALGTVALTAPWWVAVLSRHGVYPLVASGGSGWGPFAPLQLLTLAITNEPFFPVLGALAALGALACLRTRRAWLPAWVGVMVLLDARSPLATASVPIALLAGIGASQVLLPWLGWAAPDGSAGARDSSAAAPGARRRPPALVWAVGGFIAFLATLGATVDLNGVLGGLTAEQRAGMRWAAEATPPGARFLIVTGSLFPTRDRVSEWFPALGGRVSVTTIQGYEWARDDSFGQRVERYLTVQRCAYRGVACLAAWTAEHGVPWDYLYLPKGPTGASTNPALAEDCCWALRASAAADPRYEAVYDGPGGTVYRRRG
ncbi:MAG TPA: hypothetical protein VFE37_05335 [Chloroflexota bacterium]|nr:hypothetical protein [Chloroflexota bacterium]